MEVRYVKKNITDIINKVSDLDRIYRNVIGLFGR